MAHAQSYLINGSFDATISPFDRGFAYGDGVFRTMKMVGGLPDNWPLHYQKLVADCAAINIVCPSAELLMSDLQQLFSPMDLSENQLTIAKIIITRGAGNRGYTPPAITAPMRVVTQSAMPQYPDIRFSEGVSLTVCETRLASQAKLAGIKHLNRLENVLARMEWTDAHMANGIADGIMLDSLDNVIECTSNVGWVREPTLHVPCNSHRVGLKPNPAQNINSNPSRTIKKPTNLTLQAFLMPAAVV